MGRAIAAMLARAGALVVVADTETSAADAIGAAISAEGGRCDVTSRESVEAMIDTGVRASGGVDGGWIAT